MKPMASALTATAGARVALCDVAVEAQLRDLLAEVSLVQTYRNDETRAIEAVYTFALPVDAVLLALEVRLGERVLHGAVVEKAQARERYEDAIEDGDAAVMLEELEPGLYTVNVGNLLPGETARISVRYAQLHRWTGERLRFFLPTTVAPRYGDSPHAPHQTPEPSLTVENRFSLRLEVWGALRQASFDCPSHDVTLAHGSESLVLSLAQPRAVMDRDFVLDVHAPQATRSFALTGRDGEGTAALASFQPFFPGLRRPQRLTLAIVVDCSGSMAGTSMTQAKQALSDIFDRLGPEDHITLIAFGNDTKAFADSPQPWRGGVPAAARRFAADLDGTMGGTEIGNALGAAHRALAGAEAADIFLITDGEVSRWEDVVGQASASGHRVFTVGVGSAVSEAFLRSLADATGGSCELVAPREGMAERVVRHFMRLRAPRARRVQVHWPTGATDLSPADIGAVFEGDTVVACARFEAPLAGGVVTLEVETADGQCHRQALPLPPAEATAEEAYSTVARVAAAERLTALDDEAGLATALRYGLVSRWTHWLVVAERAEEERARELPLLRQVPHTLAAGWGGTGHMEVVRSPMLCHIDVQESRLIGGRPMVNLAQNLPVDAIDCIRPVSRSDKASRMRFGIDRAVTAGETPQQGTGLRIGRLASSSELQRLLALLDTLERDRDAALRELTDPDAWPELVRLLSRALELDIYPAVATLLLERLLRRLPSQLVPDRARPALDALARQASALRTAIADDRSARVGAPPQATSSSLPGENTILAGDEVLSWLEELVAELDGAGAGVRAW